MTVPTPNQQRRSNVEVAEGKSSKRGGRPKGPSPYRELRALIVERAYKVLRAAGLQHEIANEDIARAAGFKSADYLDQVRRESSARFVCDAPGRPLKSADLT
jgi:hypothetical protein